MKWSQALVRSTVAVLGLFLVDAQSRAALADTFSSFVQVTCAPEINYFSIRRFGLANLPGAALQNSNKPPTSRGIYKSIELKDAPVECTLTVGAGTGESRIRIRAVGSYNVPAGATSYRQITDHIEVWADGKQLGVLYLNPHGFGIGIDQLEVWFNGVVFVRKCSYYDHDQDPQRPAGCTTEP